MVSKTILACGVAAVSAGSIELVSSDLAAGQRALDTIKATWGQSLKVLGRSANIEAEYDRSERKNMPNQVTLSGALGKVDYELVSDLRGGNDLNLQTKTTDGTTISVDNSVNDLATLGADIATKVSASRAIKVRDEDVDLEISHERKASESKVKLSSVLGKGVKAIATLTSAGGKHSTDYEIEYETDLTEGRSLSANVDPQAGTGEIEYVDSKTIDGTITATIPLGGQPSVTVKRSWGF